MNIFPIVLFILMFSLTTNTNSPHPTAGHIVARVNFLQTWLSSHHLHLNPCPLLPLGKLCELPIKTLKIQNLALNNETSMYSHIGNTYN